MWPSSACSARWSPSGSRIIRCWPKSSEAKRASHPGPAGCSIRSTAPRTSHTACRFSARRSPSKSTASPRWQRYTIFGAVFTAEERRGAFLNGRPLCVGNRTLVHAMLVTGFIRHSFEDRETSASSVRLSPGARSEAWPAAIDLLRRRAHGWILGERPEARDIAGGALIVAEAGGRVTPWTERVYVARRHVLALNGSPTPGSRWSALPSASAGLQAAPALPTSRLRRFVRLAEAASHFASGSGKAPYIRKVVVFCGRLIPRDPTRLARETAISA